MLMRGQIILPKESDTVREFAAQCHNTAKKLEESENGSQRYNYVKLGPDHFRHAFNYMCIANTQMANNNCEIVVGESLITAEQQW